MELLSTIGLRYRFFAFGMTRTLATLFLFHLRCPVDILREFIKRFFFLRQPLSDLERMDRVKTFGVPEARNLPIMFPVPDGSNDERNDLPGPLQKLK